MKLTVEVDVPLTVVQLAELFTNLDDEQQAQFFIEAARIMSGWTNGGWAYQAHLVGRHLRECPCSTIEARDLVREIATAMGADNG